MDHRAQVCVVVVVRGRGGGIGQGVVPGEYLTKELNLGLVVAGKDAAGDVQDAAAGFAADRRRDVLPARLGDEAGKGFGDFDH